MVELLHYNSCLITAAWRGKTHSQQCNSSHCCRFLISQTAPFRFLLGKVNSTQKAPTCQLSDSHNRGEILSKRFMWALEVQTPCWITDCLWFQFRIIGDLQVKEKISSVAGFSSDIRALSAAFLINLMTMSLHLNVVSVIIHLLMITSVWTPYYVSHDCWFLKGYGRNDAFLPMLYRIAFRL